MESFLLHQSQQWKYLTKIWFENVELSPENYRNGFIRTRFLGINKIKFRKVSSNFQNQLKEDIKVIKKLKKVFIFADKTSNIYQIEKDEYNKLTTDAVTSTYKMIPDKISYKGNADGKKIIENKEVVNRRFVNGSNSCFITLKGYKPNFLNNSKIRLLNPAKNELGRISKSILDRINTSLPKFNQSKSVERH